MRTRPFFSHSGLEVGASLGLETDRVPGNAWVVLGEKRLGIINKQHDGRWFPTCEECNAFDAGPNGNGYKTRMQAAAGLLMHWGEYRDVVTARFDPLSRSHVRCRVCAGEGRFQRKQSSGPPIPCRFCGGSGEVERPVVTSA